MARRKSSAPLELPWWIRAVRTPPEWPTYAAWQQSIDEWFIENWERPGVADAFFDELLSLPVFSPAPEWEVPNGEAE